MYEWYGETYTYIMLSWKLSLSYTGKHLIIYIYHIMWYAHLYAGPQAISIYMYIHIHNRVHDMLVLVPRCTVLNIHQMGKVTCSQQI